MNTKQAREQAIKFAKQKALYHVEALSKIASELWKIDETEGNRAIERLSKIEQWARSETNL